VLSQVDPDLPFLNSLVAHALAQGHAAYKPASERQPKHVAPAIVDTDASRLGSAFRFEAYDAPVEPAASTEGLFAGIGGSAGPSESGSVKGGSGPASGASTPKAGRRVLEGRKLNKPASGLQVRVSARGIIQLKDTTVAVSFLLPGAVPLLRPPHSCSLPSYRWPRSAGVGLGT